MQPGFTPAPTGNDMADDEAKGYCLLVDDSSVIRKVARRILADRYADFGEAATGREALALFRHHRPDVVMLDADLPDATPADLLPQLRALPGGDRAFIVMCLYELDLSRIMRAKRAGADGYILKPFDRAYLTAQFDAFFPAR